SCMIRTAENSFTTERNWSGFGCQGAACDFKSLKWEELGGGSRPPCRVAPSKLLCPSASSPSPQHAGALHERLFEETFLVFLQTTSNELRCLYTGGVLGGVLALQKHSGQLWDRRCSVSEGRSTGQALTASSPTPGSELPAESLREVERSLGAVQLRSFQLTARFSRLQPAGAHCHQQLTDGTLWRLGRIFHTSQGLECKSKESLLKVSPPDDEETKSSAETLARFIADGGPEVEAIALQNARENPAFRFLCEPNSKGYKYYRQKLEEFRKAKSSSLCVPLPGPEPSLKRKSSPEASPSPLRAASLPLPSPVPLPIPSPLPVPSALPSPSSSTTPPEQTAATAAATATPATAAGTTKKKRKSRWGPEEDKVELPLPQLVQQLDSPSPLSVQDLKGLGYEKGKPVGLVGVTELSDAQKKQLKEQQEVSPPPGVISAFPWSSLWPPLDWLQHFHVLPVLEAPELHPGLYRAALRPHHCFLSSVSWAEWAEQLTQMGRGKHFIGDFLPPDELEKFMETFKALKEGREPDYSEYKEFKLTVENIGYQMLMKMGWKEGEGLGSDGQGIKNPVSK
ncbi:SUGP1 protein, partial [Semnornis frantzii]|nr:SUGP1 protein [Semnornis frantzii]